MTMSSLLKRVASSCCPSNRFYPTEGVYYAGCGESYLRVLYQGQKGKMPKKVPSEAQRAISWTSFTLTYALTSPHLQGALYSELKMRGLRVADEGCYGSFSFPDQLFKCYSFDSTPKLSPNGKGIFNVFSDGSERRINDVKTGKLAKRYHGYGIIVINDVGDVTRTISEPVNGVKDSFEAELKGALEASRISVTLGSVRLHLDNLELVSLLNFQFRSDSSLCKKFLRYSDQLG